MTNPDRDELVKLADIRSANIARQKEWDAGNQLTLAYRGNELAGEVGEACNVIKKLERERLGIKGSRDTVAHLAEELADVVICADLIAMHEGIDLLGKAVPAKFNATSEKVGLKTRLYPSRRLAEAGTQTPAPSVAVKSGRVTVPPGQTPLDDKLGHRYLDVIKEGATARDTGMGSPYHGHSLEHCLHAAGWVSRDLRLALDKAKASALITAPQDDVRDGPTLAMETRRADDNAESCRQFCAALRRIASGAPDAAAIAADAVKMPWLLEPLPSDPSSTRSEVTVDELAAFVRWSEPDGGAIARALLDQFEIRRKK